MRRYRSGWVVILFAAVLGSGWGWAVPAEPPGDSPPKKPPWTIKGLDSKSADFSIVMEALNRGRLRIEKFFGRPFPKPFIVEVFPSRADFDQYMQQRWKIPKTSSWMVASGVADTLTLLDRSVWKTQASEHDPSSDDHLRELIAHELVHVYHGQHNPIPDFEGMDELGWWVEGLAVYVSGQLEGSHRQAAREAIRAGQAPKTLAKAWSGRYRYGVSGSIARYIDQRYGREKTRELLKVVNQQQALEALHTTEAALLEDWVNHVKNVPH